MSLNLSTRLAHAWNAFTSRDPTQYIITGPGYSSRPDRPRLSRGNEKSIATSIFNRIALDVSSVSINIADWIKTVVMWKISIPD